MKLPWRLRARDRPEEGTPCAQAQQAAGRREESQVVQVLIVDDYAPVRREIRAMLQRYPDIHVMGEARNGLEAIFLVEKFRPRIVLMDINMPKMNGIEATAQITRICPETIIIGFSANANAEAQEAIQRAGAVQLIPKEQADDLLYDAIHEAVMNR